MLELVVEPADRKAKKPRIPATPPAGVVPVPAASVPPANATSMAPVSQQSRVRLASYQPPAQKAARKAVTPGAARGPAAPRNNLPILTLDRFEQAMQIARLAAEHDLSELSTRAVRDALRAGPPVVPTNPNETRRVVRMRGVVDDGPVDQASPRVVANLIELERIWQKHNLPAESVYQALRDAVLPATRPNEIFLYAPPLSSTALRRPQSVGALLATAAVHAGKVDDLKAAIAAPRPGTGRPAGQGIIGSARIGRHRFGPERRGNQDHFHASQNRHIAGDGRAGVSRRPAGPRSSRARAGGGRARSARHLRQRPGNLGPA